MTHLITADSLHGINNQNEAGNVLRKLLKDVPRGTAKLDPDATKSIEKSCPALARNIHNAVDDWNHNRHSFISEQSASQFGVNPISRTKDPPCVGPYFL